jgi:hypothetical protein
MQRLLEIRSYRLKPGSVPQMQKLMDEASLPLLKAWATDVVAHGPMPHEPDGYFLMRAYDSPEHRQAAQDAFYASSDWRRGPREAVIALIETSFDTTLWLPSAAIDALRQAKR